MKRLFKVLGILLLSILFILLLSSVFIYFRGIPVYETGTVSLKVDVTPERIAKGQKIASVLCVECHLGNDNKLSGKLIPDLPPEFGTIYSKNITNHPKAGIGSWTDGELYYLLRTGIGRNGQYIPPYMVKFPLASEDDIFNIIAYLRSDKPVVQASENIQPPSQPSFLTKFLCVVAFKPLPLMAEAIPNPDTSNRVIWGKYLATAVYQCYACHSADFKSNNELDPEKSAGYFGGGNKLLNKNGEPVYSSNLTFDESGIGAYSLEEFILAVKSGKKRDGAQVQYPMVPHSNLTDNEIGAMYDYLRTIPKLKSSRKSL